MDKYVVNDEKDYSDFRLAVFDIKPLVMKTLENLKYHEF